MGQALARPGMIMAFPGNRHASGRRRNFEKYHPAVRVGQVMNISEGDTGFGVLRHLHLGALQPLRFRTVIAANNFPGFVVHAKNKPGLLQATKIGFVGQGREVFTYLVRLVVAAGLLKFYDFILPIVDQFLQQDFQFMLFVFHSVFTSVPGDNCGSVGRV